MAAKAGVPDPNSNLALRAAIDKYKSLNVTKEVIQRAIEKAKGGQVESYVEGRYEGFTQGNAYIIIDTLTDNVRRAYDQVRLCFTKKGGHLGTPGSVAFNFTETGLITFVGDNVDEVTDNLIMGDINVEDVSQDEDLVVVKVEKSDLMKAKTVLNEMGISEFETCEITMLPNEEVTVSGEDAQKFNELLDMLDEADDVQNVYHNAIVE